MRVAALDYGKVRIGVAVSDDLGAMAHPRPAIDASNLAAAVRTIATFAKDEEIERFLVGLPLDMRATAGKAAAAARAFAQKVADATGLDVELVDERLSTVQASRELHASGVSAKKAKGKIDSVAACVLLQAWLDAQAKRP